MTSVNIISSAFRGPSCPIEALPPPDFSSAAIEDNFIQQWPDQSYSVAGAEKLDNTSAHSDWPTKGWEAPDAFLKYSMQGCEVLDRTFDTSDTSLTPTSNWDSKQSLCSPLSDYGPTTESSSIPYYTSPHPPPPPAPPSGPAKLASHTKPAQPLHPSTTESRRTKRQCRSREPKDERASRAHIREKNRIAADKCRGKQRIAVEKLRSSHDSMEAQNRRLSRTLKDLVAERIVLKNMLIEHGGCGCELIANYLRDSAAKWVRQGEPTQVDLDAT